MSTFLAKLRALFRRRDLEAEMAEEMRQHLEHRIQEKITDGMTLEEARYAAQREFGGVAQVQEQCRDERGIVWLESWWQDLRYATRSLRKAPVFCVMTILTLALGIAASTTIFSVVRGVLLRPLPWPRADHLVMLWQEKPHGSGRELITGAQLTRWRETGLFSHLAYWPAWPGAQDFKLSRDEGLEPIRGAFVSSGLFQVLGVTPMLGRPFAEEEDNHEAAPSAILSHGLWQRRFGGSPDVLGRSIIVDTFRRRSYQVVGVMPPGFDFPGDAELWLPTGWMGVTIEPGGNGHWFQVLASLAPGVTVEQARAELNSSELADRLAGDDVSRIAVVPLLDQTIGPKMRVALMVLSSAVGFLLLISCANVGNLLLARGAGRTKEIGVRLALGAGRKRIARQFMIETLLLAGGAGGVGVLASWWAVDLLLLLQAGTLPRANEVSVDGTVLIFAVAISFVTGLIASIVPLFQVLDTDLNEMLKSSGSNQSATPRHQRLRAALMVSEIAFAVILLAGAMLMGKSFVRLDREGDRFRSDNLSLARLDLTSLSDNEGMFLPLLLERVGQYPGVTRAAAVTRFPVAKPNDQFFTFVASGYAEKRITGDILGCTSEYFATLGIPHLRGRSFDGTEGTNTAKVALINETMARQFGGADPIGQRITFLQRDGTPDSTWREIIGIVADTKNAGLESPVLPEVYAPQAQWSWPQATLILRTLTDGAPLAAALRHDVQALSRNVPLPELQPASFMIEQWMGPARFRTLLMTAFGGLALVLMLVGIYSVVSYSVAQRTREIGLRMALGAQVRDVLRLVLGQGLKLAAIGVAAGLLGAIALTRSLASLLYLVRPIEGVVFLSIPILVGLVTLLACWWPARRATKVDPIVALRCE